MFQNGKLRELALTEVWKGSLDFTSRAVPGPKREPVGSCNNVDDTVLVNLG